MENLILHSERLLIRNLQTTDLEDFYSYRSNPEIAKYQSFEPYTKEKAATFIASQKDRIFGKPGQWLQCGLEEKTTKRLVGDCAIKLDEDDPRIAEIGITISHLHQKKGFGKEALLTVMQFLFEKQNIHRIVETIDAENEASLKLIESVGFRKEGHFIENIFFKGKWGSECQYAMLKREWEEKLFF